MIMFFLDGKPLKSFNIDYDYSKIASTLDEIPSSQRRFEFELEDGSKVVEVGQANIVEGGLVKINEKIISAANA